jgi:hypothetical protein
VVLVGVDTHDNNRSGQGLVLHLVPASRVVGSEEALADEAEDSEAASAVIEEVALVTEEALVATEVVVDSMIEAALAAEVGSDIKVVVDLEAAVGIRTVLLPQMHPVDQVVAVVGMVVNLTGQAHPTTVIVAAIAMAIAMGIAEAAPVEAQGMTAAIREEA